MGEVILFKKRKKDKHVLYKQALDKHCLNLAEGDCESNIAKMAYYSMNYILTMPDNATYDQLMKYDSIAFVAKAALMIMRLKDIKNAFPIDKTYDGVKYDVKDYFSTVEEFAEWDEDDRITDERIDEFLWEYNNRTIRKFTIKSMLIKSSLLRMQGREGIGEQFMHSMGIDTYTMNDKGELERNERKPVLRLIKNDELEGEMK